MARRTLTARGESLRLIPSWRGPFGVEMAGEVLLPGPGAQIAPTAFDFATSAFLGIASRNSAPDATGRCIEPRPSPTP